MSNINVNEETFGAQSDRNKYVALSADYLTGLGYDVALVGKGRFAQFTYNVNDIGKTDVKHNNNTNTTELLVNLAGHQCPQNSTTTTLTANEVFIGGGWQDALDYGMLTISVESDVDSAEDGLEVQWSSDGINESDVDAFTIIGNIPKTFTFGPAQRYYRVKYTNGDQDQSLFRLASILRRTYVKPSSHRIKDSIVADDDAELVKAVVTGRKPDGTFTNANLTQQSNLKVSIDEYGDTTAIDAFDRLRVSTPYTLFDSKQLHDKQPLFWDEELSGSATSVHLSADACTMMTVLSAGDYVIRQSKQRFNYQPAKSTQVLFTFHMEQEDGVRKRMGQFTNDGGGYLDAFNGIFLEVSGNKVSWNIAKNGVVTEKVFQEDWNVDTLSGDGYSLETLDLNAPQIGTIDYEWLGVGRVRVGFVIGGLIRYVHYFNHANVAEFDSVYMSTPNLPLRYEIYSDGGSGSMDHICSSVVSEGGIEENGILRAVDTGTTFLNANVVGDTYAVIGIRLKEIYKDITVYPEYFSMLAKTSTAYKWSVILNPTVAGTFTYVDVENSAIQRAIGATANTVTGGVIIDSGYIQGSLGSTGNQGNRKLSTALRIGSNIDGSKDTIVLCVSPLDANADIFGSLTIRELL